MDVIIRDAHWTGWTNHVFSRNRPLVVHCRRVVFKYTCNLQGKRICCLLHCYMDVCVWHHILRVVKFCEIKEEENKTPKPHTRAVQNTSEQVDRYGGQCISASWRYMCGFEFRDNTFCLESFHTCPCSQADKFRSVCIEFGLIVLTCRIDAMCFSCTSWMQFLFHFFSSLLHSPQCFLTVVSIHQIWN